jgi:putative transposase
MAKQKKMNGGKHTANREKTRIKLARIYEKVENRRKDWLHNLSTKIVRENQTICLEDLAVQNMQRNHCLAGSIASVAWSIFVRMLTYKSEWYGKNLIQIGRFEPSSRICSECGCYNGKLTLADRTWACECGTLHDRDINAAKNIKTFALHNQNLIREKIPLHKREFTLGEIEACKVQSGNQEQAPRLAVG